MSTSNQDCGRVFHPSDCGTLIIDQLVDRPTRKHQQRVQHSRLLLSFRRIATGCQTGKKKLPVDHWVHCATWVGVWTIWGKRVDDKVSNSKTPKKVTAPSHLGLAPDEKSQLEMLRVKMVPNDVERCTLEADEYSRTDGWYRLREWLYCTRSDSERLLGLRERKKTWKQGVKLEAWSMWIRNEMIESNPNF